MALGKGEVERGEKTTTVPAGCAVGARGVVGRHWGASDQRGASGVPAMAIIAYGVWCVVSGARCVGGAGCRHAARLGFERACLALSGCRWGLVGACCVGGGCGRCLERTWYDSL